MTENKTDALVKPDMKAVLSRTHLANELHSFLLPILEAVSNAIHGIEEKFGEDASKRGKINILFENPNDPSSILISVSDNGVGLNDENYRSFKTPFSGFKLKKKGRGFGRFVAFKVFARILYSSRYEFFNDKQSRTFRFDINQEKEFIYFDGEPDFPNSGTKVEYNQPLTTWHDLIRSLDSSEVADEIGSHFLPLFLYSWLPEIAIQFGNNPPESITSHFKEVFVQSDSGEIECEIDGALEKLDYSLTKIPKTRSFKNHCLLFSAADRIVGAPRDLSNKLGQPHFLDQDNQKYIVIAVVRSDAFEARLNDARTSININAKAIERIVSAISSKIEEKEQRQINKIKSDQQSALSQALRANPILRLGLRGRSVNEYVGKSPNNWKAEQFISDLAIERARASQDLTKAIASAAGDPEGYAEKIRNIVGKIDEVNKEALAEYVIHRKNVIELVETARKYRDDDKYDAADGKHKPEDVIHDLIFKRFSDTVKVDYFEHNLWLVDDALAFLPYISSDRPFQGGRRKKGDKIADLAFFDDSMILGDNDGTSVTIVEFKRPSRNDYRFGNEKHDPVLQILNTIEAATKAGGISKSDGTDITLSGAVRRFGYIVADLKPSLLNVLHKHNFKADWNPRIHSLYHGNERIFIQAFGYDTLIENAKKRNQAFFSVLFGE